MTTWISAFISAVALVLSAPLLAQTVIAIDNAKPWSHGLSGLKIPTSVAGYTRLEVKDFGKSQSDVSVSFRNRESGTFVTLYAFRAGIPDVSIWADRAEGSIIIAAEQHYGTLDQAGRRWTRFSPWDNSKDAGLRLVYPLSGKRSTATGLLMVRHGEWLFKVRMTSSQLNADQLDTQLSAFFSGLAIRAPKTGGGAAYAVRPCKTQLSTAKVRQLKADASEIFLPTIIDALDEDSPSKRPALYCRQDGDNPSFAIYRPGESIETYVIAVGDGGMTVRVLPWPITTKGRERPFVSVLLFTNDRIVGYPRFDATPGWEQAVDAVNGSSPSFESGRTPETRKETQIFIDPTSD